LLQDTNRMTACAPQIDHLPSKPLDRSWLNAMPDTHLDQRKLRLRALEGPHLSPRPADGDRHHDPAHLVPGAESQLLKGLKCIGPSEAPRCLQVRSQVLNGDLRNTL